MPTSDESLLQVYHAGRVTVVGFGGRQLTRRIDFAPYRHVLTELVERQECKILAVDLAGVSMVPAGMLGVLVSIRRHVERIEIHNPSAAARETLASIQVNSLFHIHDSTA